MRLVPKVFLWFWLGIVLVSATAVGLTEFTHSRAKDDEHWREHYGPRLDLWARQETQILDRQGTDALRKYVASFETDPGVRNFIFDAAGHEVLSQQAPGDVLWVVSSMQDASNAEQQLLATQRIAAEKIVRGSGRGHIVVVAYPQPSVLASPLLDFLTEDLGQAQIVRFAAVLGVATEDLVELRQGERSLRLPVFVLPGHADDAVTLPLGYGRQGTEAIARGVGVDAYSVRTSEAP